MSILPPSIQIAMDINSILPNEILSQILHHLKSKDLFTCRSVCSLWESIVDETVGVKLYLGSQPPGHYWPKSKRALFKPISAIREYGITKCYINRLVQRSLLTRQVGINWMTPHLLKRLRIDGRIHASLFNHLIKGLINLKSLTLHFNVLPNLQLLDVKFGNLAKLEEFSIYFWGDELERTVNMEEGIEQWVTLLESQEFTFPRLKGVNLSWPLSSTYLRILHRGISCFCRRHAITLKKFELCYYDMENVPPLEPLGRDPGPQLTLADFQGINLESFQFHVLIGWMEPEMDIWMMLMNQQQRLKSVMYSAFPELVHILPPIQNCKETLAKVDFTVDMAVGVPGGPLNMAVLGSCPNLVELKISACCFGDRTEETEPDLTFGGARFPKSLRVVHLTGLLVSTKDILAILDDQPLLQDVDLRDNGTHGTFGLPFSKLFQIFQDRQIEDIYVNSALNRDSFQVGAESKDPSLRLAWSFFCMGLGMGQKLSGKGFRLRLNSSGFYQVNGHPVSTEDPSDDEDDNGDF